MKRLLLALLFTFASFAQAPDDATIRKLLAGHQAPGIVAGVIEPKGRRVVSLGSFTQNDKRSIGADTVFEIGSVTKVFTSLLLADMVSRGEVALGDPISKYLPAEVNVPQVTLGQLASHTSGLPRLPGNMAPKDPTNPYADYTVKQMYDALGAIDVGSGAKYDYSNLGAGLLGHVLARRAGTDYETLVRKRILEPLGMKSTSITLTPAMKERLAIGHDDAMKATPNWDLPTLAGAGALRSTTNDLLTFLAAVLDYKTTTLRPAMNQMIVAGVRKPTSIPGTEIGLGWHMTKNGDKEIIWHNGGTGGYRSFVGFDPKQRVGVVILANSTKSPDAIGRALLDPSAPRQTATVKVDAKILERYTGRYELAPNFILTVTREGEQLYAQATGQPRFEIAPESETKFFVKGVDAKITFEDGALILHQNGDHRAKRIGVAPPPKKEPKEVAVDPKIFAKYIGKYELAPTFVLDVTTDGEKLYVQATGQMRLQVFPSGEREFFYKAVDAQITFNVDEAGRVTSLVLHQNGMDAPGKKIE